MSLGVSAPPSIVTCTQSFDLTILLFFIGLKVWPQLCQVAMAFQDRGHFIFLLPLPAQMIIMAFPGIIDSRGDYSLRNYV